MRQLTAAFGYEEPPSVPRVVPLRELRLTQVHLVLTTRSAWLTVRSTVESLFSTGTACRNGPCIGAEALVEHVQQSMGERGIYYDTMPYRDPRMEACERRLYFGDFVVLGRAASRLVDLEDDPDRLGHQRWAITRFGRSERNALALLWHVERLEWRERGHLVGPQASRSAIEPVAAESAGRPPQTLGRAAAPAVLSNITSSGVSWISRFPTSTSTSDLAQPFRGNADRFISSLRSGGANVRIAATLRPPQRAYLMHYSYLVAHGADPTKIPKMQDVDIDWVHRDADGNADLPASRAAAQQMVNGYGIVYAPALTSRHSEGNAIDMSITNYQTKSFVNGKGDTVTVSNQGDLNALGASYGVYKLASDPPHWSSDGH